MARDMEVIWGKREAEMFLRKGVDRGIKEPPLARKYDGTACMRLTTDS